MVIEGVVERVTLIVAAVAITLAGLFFGLYRHAENERAIAQTGLDAAKKANKTNNGTIGDLAGRLEACSATNKANASALASEVSKRQAAEAVSREAQATERAKRDQLYETDADCGALRRVPVCSAIADRVRMGAEAARRNAHD